MKLTSVTGLLFIMTEWHKSEKQAVQWLTIRRGDPSAILNIITVIVIEHQITGQRQTLHPQLAAEWMSTYLLFTLL